MRIIKLDATDSTNSYLRDLIALETLDDYTVVTAKKQNQGRGQMGAVWSSQTSKSLTFSVFKDVSGLDIDASFSISMISALAIIKALQSFSIPKLRIKWPNDILSGDKKICGILIENVIKQNNLNASIIGVGLNVNETEFKNLPRATSLKLISGNNFNLEEVLLAILESLKSHFSIFHKGNYALLKEEYESHLFRKNIPSTFKNCNNLTFSGFIQGVSNSGNLQILLEDNIIKEFNLKEITLLY
ncbi:biotin--[acetyl-CoA-carboxylase] ligase [uncultured Algibacter sp.]|uniref:biotin--[acetyl-CoA-carboxylase] ligase n=1 Tax=uncultured Algibacter sp. TaxID=298659 RepID=UPI002613CFB8|nr:biotin--[acetyl-CoA-carboxylase] ligase [uncultured Algibacter sp.]